MVDYEAVTVRTCWMGLLDVRTRDLDVLKQMRISYRACAKPVLRLYDSKSVGVFVWLFLGASAVVGRSWCIGQVSSITATLWQRQRREGRRGRSCTTSVRQRQSRGRSCDDAWHRAAGRSICLIKIAVLIIFCSCRKKSVDYMRCFFNLNNFTILFFPKICLILLSWSFFIFSYCFIRINELRKSFYLISFTILYYLTWKGSWDLLVLWALQISFKYCKHIVGKELNTYPFIITG